MPQFDINFVAPIEVSATEIVHAASPAAAEAIVFSLQKSNRITWTFRGINIGGYTGPINQIWATPNGPGTYLVSLVANVQVAAQAGSITADDAPKAVSHGHVLHSKGLLPWAYQGIKLGVFTGKLGPLWALPAQNPILPSTVTTISITPPVELGVGASSTFSYGTQAFVYAQVNQGATGQVQFLLNGVAFAVENLDKNGIGILDTTFIPPGVQSITANYLGNANLAPSVSDALPLTVTEAGVSISLSVLPSSSSTGQTLFLTARVSSLLNPTYPGTQPIEGQVEFFYRTPLRHIGFLIIPAGPEISLGFGSVDEYGDVYLDTTNVPIGVGWQIKAQYFGSPYYQSGNSAQVSHTVTKGTPQIQLVMTPNPASIGQSVNLHAIVSPLGPTGTVTFGNHTTSTIFGTTAVDVLGNASIDIGSLTSILGNQTGFYALYNGDTNFFPVSTSPDQTLAVSGYTTSIGVVASNPSPFYNQAFSLTVTVSTTGGGTPTGSVTVTGNQAYGTFSLSGGQVTLNFGQGGIASIVPGETLSFQYNGDSTHSTSLLSGFTTGCLPGPSIIVISSSVNPVHSGSSTTLTAQVTYTYGGAFDGIATFLVDGSSIGTSAFVSSSQAHLNHVFSNPGPHNLTVQYLSTSGHYALSTSTTVVQGVQATSSISAVSSPSSPYINQAFTATAQVTSSQSGTPTGSVTFQLWQYSYPGYFFASNLGTVALSGGQASKAVTTAGNPGIPNEGYYQIRVSYNGDNTFAPSDNTASPDFLFVNFYPVTVGVSASPQYDPFYGNPVTLHATVTSPAGGTVQGGTMYFYSNSGIIGSASVVNGVASLGLPGGGGTQSYFYAYYGGNATHQTGYSGNFYVNYGYY